MMDELWTNYFQIHKEYLEVINANLTLIKDFFTTASNQGLELTPDYTTWSENSYYVLGWIDHDLLILLDEEGAEVTALRKINNPITKENFESGWNLIKLEKNPNRSIIFFKENEECIEHLLKNKNFYFDGSGENLFLEK